ncbi:YigZ family protein [Marinomonas agarivorans]|nr:YigZ family protein [Marinomonas agarivorans]
MDYFLSPTKPQRFDLEIKRSLFITQVFPTQGKDEVKKVLQQTRAQFPDANHHCWACVAGHPNNVHQWDQSDDGEPKGTAGKPMLNVLQHSDFGEVTVITTRYFGGIKLGAGGLVRAYSQAVQEALSQTESHAIYPRHNVTLTLSYSLVGKVEYWLENSDIEIQDKQFAQDITFALGVIPTSWPQQKQALLNLCQGQAVLKEH